MPEGEEYDRLDREKLEHGVILGEQFSRGWVEEDQAIEGDSDGEVVGKGAVEVAIPGTVHVCVWVWEWNLKDTIVCVCVYEVNDTPTITSKVSQTDYRIMLRSIHLKEAYD